MSCWSGVYREQLPSSTSKPTSGAASNLAYNRPEFLGGVPNLPVQQPPSEDFVYGHGYTTYQKPFYVGHTVKEYKPSPYLKANSFQDLFQVLYKNFMKEWNSLFDGGLRPNYWNNYPNQKPKTK